MRHRVLLRTTLTFAVLLNGVVLSTAAATAATPVRATDTATAVRAPSDVTFTDVAPSNVFAADIAWLASTGITTGFPDGTFKPTGSVDRQAMAAFAFRLANPDLPDPTCTTAPYPDVPARSPFCGVISWAKTTGITTGFADGTFKPGANITRAAAAAFLHRATGSPSTACTAAPFTDVPATDPLCADIAWAAGNGVSSGYQDKSFHPAEQVTRQAVAAFLHRVDTKVLIPITLDGTVGASGIGDPYYPSSGNGGYDVQSYDVGVTYDPVDKDIVARTTIVADVTQSSTLGRFSLDLAQTMKVSSVTVNNRAADITHASGELVITPRSGLPTGRRMVVVVDYSGVPNYITGGTAGGLGDGGWTPLDDGGAIVAGEPFSSSSWFPSNEHPLDRAFYTVTATVPDGWNVIANGNPITTGLPAAPEGWKVFKWGQAKPTLTYLTTLYIDKFTTTTSTSTSGVPIINAFAPGGGEKFVALAEKTNADLTFLESAFGPYPFDAVGGIFSNEPLNFALETQTRPVYADWVDNDTIVHELAHQWFGDSVAVKSWADICLNECFASYAEWLYHETTAGQNLDTTYKSQITRYKNRPSFWAKPLVDMGVGNEFTDVYARGPLALHALRREIGDANWKSVITGWAADKAGQNVSFADFETYVNTKVGRDLTPFFKAWFRSSGIPADTYLYPGTLGG